MELISDVQNPKTEEPRKIVFKLSVLRKELCKRLKLQGVTAENPEMHPTRLKEKLIEAIPQLTAHIESREVLPAFEEDIGSLIPHAFPESVGKDQYRSFLKEMITERSKPIDGSISRNKLPFRNPMSKNST